jgi:hypothetical protein
MSLEQFQNTHTVNLTGSFLLIRRYLQGLERHRDSDKGTPVGNVAVVLIGSTGTLVIAVIILAESRPS